jgi:hypothetical protein
LNDDGRSGSSRRVFFVVVAIATAVSLLAVVARTFQAAADGDDELVRINITASIVGLGSLVLLLLVVICIFIPGPAHARRVAAKFPESLVFFGNFGTATRAEYRHLVGATTSTRIPIIGVTVKVDIGGFSLWTGVFTLTETLRVPWVEMVQIKADIENYSGSRFPGLKFDFQTDGETESLTFIPGRGKFIGLGRLSEAELNTLRDKLLAFRGPA